MEKGSHKINVRIGGMFYNLVSGESEEYTRHIAAKADEMIRRVSMASPNLSQQMTIVLALVNAADELTRLGNQQNSAEQQQQAAEQKNSELRTELAKARELNWEMKKEILRLSTMLREGKPAEQPAQTETAVAPKFEARCEVAAENDTRSSVDDPAVLDAIAEAEPEALPVTPIKTVPEIKSDLAVESAEPAAVSEVNRSASARISAVWGEPDEPVEAEPEPRPLEQLRQTGLDEYLSQHTSSRSTVEYVSNTDEP